MKRIKAKMKIGNQKQQYAYGEGNRQTNNINKGMEFIPSDISPGNF
tara:strand:- start:552 stop:689 length:138 start_codon:yes stop_codon:yes gene_type:complete